MLLHKALNERVSVRGVLAMTHHWSSGMDDVVTVERRTFHCWNTFCVSTQQTLLDRHVVVDNSFSQVRVVDCLRQVSGRLFATGRCITFCPFGRSKPWFPWL